MASADFEVIVGTYEQFLLGYTVDDVVNKYKMEQSFATHSHMASIRSVASARHYMASSAADDTISLFDMRSRMSSGKLTHHTDTVTCLAFTPDGSHLMSGSSDGSIGIVRCGNWQLEKHWLKPHKGMGIEAIAIHPTGRLAMSIGRDGALRTWNLIKGRQAYATNLVPRWKGNAPNINVIKWSPDGLHYIIAAGTKVDVYSVATAGIVRELTFDTKVVCVEYLSDNLIAIGFENGKINLYNIEDGVQTFEKDAHNARVKCMVSKDSFLLSASSAGEIKLWSFDKDNLKMLNKVSCNARISCMTITSCKSTVVKEKESVITESVPEKKRTKIRIRQEVIIEDEGAEEVQTEENKKKKKKKKKKNNTNSEKICTSNGDGEAETKVEKVLQGSKKRKHESEVEQDSVSQETENTVAKKKSKKKKHKPTKSDTDSQWSVSCVSSVPDTKEEQPLKEKVSGQINKNRKRLQGDQQPEKVQTEGKKFKNKKMKVENKQMKRRSDEQNPSNELPKKKKKGSIGKN